MGDVGRRFRFALDQNYPAPVIKAFGVMMPQVELVARVLAAALAR